MTISRRARRYTTATCVIRSWAAQDGPYRVAEITSLFGLPKLYLAIQRQPGGGETIVSRHRKRSAAIRAIEKIT